MRPGTSGFSGQRCVYGEDNAGRLSVMGQVSGDGLCVADLCSRLRQVNAQCGPDVVVDEGDADEAFAGPKPQSVSDETESVCSVLIVSGSMAFLLYRLAGPGRACQILASF